MAYILLRHLAPDNCLLHLDMYDMAWVYSYELVSILTVRQNVTICENRTETVQCSSLLINLQINTTVIKMYTEIHH